MSTELAQRITALKTPPHSIESEQAVLAAVMLDQSAWPRIADKLTPADFYRKEHRLMWEAMAAQVADGKPIDVITLSESLMASGKLREAGGVDYLGELLDSNQSASNIEAYAAIVKERSVLRQLISLGHSIADSGYNAEGRTSDELLASAQSGLMAIDASTKDAEPVSITKSLKAAVKYLEDRYNGGGGMVGLSTGFKDLDAMTGGLRDGEMILVAGRPSMGKSTIAQNIIEKAALSGKHVLFFSVEMPEQMVSLRHMASCGSVELDRLMKADMDHAADGAMVAVSKLKDRFYTIDDSPSLTSSQMLARAQRVAMKAGKRIDLIVIDYLQKLRDKGENQNTRVGEISANTKHLAREMSCPVIALSQLSRECEKRPLAHRRPVLSDLRDSGNLEQDADVVLFVYREEVYDPQSKMSGIAEVVCAKNRNGPTGSCLLASQLQFARFQNFAGKRPEENRRASSYGLE